MRQYTEGSCKTDPLAICVRAARYELLAAEVLNGIDQQHEKLNAFGRAAHYAAGSPEPPKVNYSKSDVRYTVKW